MEFINQGNIIKISWLIIQAILMMACLKKNKGKLVLDFLTISLLLNSAIFVFVFRIYEKLPIIALFCMICIFLVFLKKNNWKLFYTNNDLNNIFKKIIGERAYIVIAKIYYFVFIPLVIVFSVLNILSFLKMFSIF